MDISRTLATGDLNGDGVGDLVIASDSHGALGAVHIVFGRASWSTNVNTMPAIADVTLSGAVGQRMARAVTVGDLNGDGIGDLVVGSTLFDPGGLEDAGAVLIYFGANTWPATLGLTDAHVTLAGDVAFGQFGYSLCAADLDGDGTDDLAVTAPWHSFTRTMGGVETNLVHYGKVYLFRGTNHWPAAPALDTAMTVIHGIHENSLVGSHLWAGDVNGDGRADLFLGANQALPTGVTPGPPSKKIGIVWGILGRAAALWPASDDLLHFESATLGELVDFYTQGNNAAYGIGYRGACGDFDGDGLQDVVIGGIPSGSALYVFFGRTNFGEYEPMTPTDADVRRDRVLYWGVATSLNFVVNSIAVGDFDGDGLDDLATGFSTANVSGRNQVGLVALRYGRSSWPLLGEDDDVLYHGEAATDALGTMVALGDVTGDGKADLLMSAPNADRTGASNVGKVYLVTGHHSPPSMTLAISGGTATLALHSRSGRTCRLEVSENLLDWSPLATWNSDGSIVSTNETVTPGSRFYRVLANPRP